MPTHKYYIDGIERTPINAGEFQITEALFTEAGAYFMRKKLSTAAKFNKKDYDFLRSRATNGDLDQIFKFRIDKIFAPPIGTVTIFNGRFSLKDLAFNDDLCEVEVSMDTDDQYSCILDNWDKQYNVAQLSDLSTVYRVDSGTEVQIAVGQGTTASPPTFVFSNQGSSDPNDYGVPIEEFTKPFLNLTPGGGNPDIDLIFYCREVVYTACVAGVPQEPDGGGWTLLDASGCSPIGGFASWWRRFDYTPFFTFDAFVNPPITFYPYGFTTDTGVPPIPDPNLSGNFGLYTGVLSPPDQDLFFDRATLRSVEEDTQSRYIKGARTLIDVANAMLRNICGTGISVSSDFLTNATNPITSQPNICQNLQLWTKSDVANAQATEADALTNLQASDIKLTVRELFDDIYKHLQIRWYRDPLSGQVIWEHITDIKPAIVDLDVTVIDGGKWVKNRNSFVYRTDQVVIEEQWRFITASLPDFVGLPITYTTNSDKIATYNTSQIDTELAVLLGDQNQRDLDGFILVQPESITETGSLAQNGIIWNFFSPNMPLSISNTHDKFWRDERRLPTGRLNGVPTTFNSSIKLTQQNAFVFRICNPESFNRRKLVLSSYGPSEIQELSYDLTNEIMTITLNFDL